MTTHTLNLDELAASLANGSHSVFSPSASAMWLECAGSLIPNVLAEDDGNEDSAYGTVAHSVTEAWLQLGRKPKHMLGQKHFVPVNDDFGYTIVADDEMFDYAKQCVDRCVMLPGQHFIEQRVDFSHLTPIPKQGGTLDFAAWDAENDTLYVVDQKFGSSPNNIVYAERNPQLMLYAIGLCRKLNIRPQRIVIRINQPRLDHFDEWLCTLPVLSKFSKQVKERAALAWSLDAPRTPGIKQCRWCRVKSTCAAHATLNERITEGVFGPVDDAAVADLQARLSDPGYSMRPTPVRDLSTAQMARLLPYQPMIETWLKEMRAELELRAMRGERVPDHKLVEARTKRRWKNKSAAEKALIALGVDRKELVLEKMVSPNQAEKALIGAGVARADLPNVLAPLVDKPAGKPTLAPAHDKRQEWVDPSESVFADLATSDENEEL